MVVYGQELDGRPSDERPTELTPFSFGRDVKPQNKNSYSVVKLGVPCLDAACIVGLNYLKKLGITAFSKQSKQ